MSDKRSKFEGVAGEAPLVVTGSFGLGGGAMRREPSAEKGRISLGGGRPSFSSDVVTASPSRSVSSSSPSIASEPDLARGTASEAPPAIDSLLRATALSRAGSVSSLQVETGSNSGGDLDGLKTPTSPTGPPSPLSSPMVAGTAVLDDPVPSIDAATPLEPHTPLRGPLTSLRAGPTRTMSTLSISSMQVETGSSTSDETPGDFRSSAPAVDTPTGLRGKTFEVETFDTSVNAEGTGLGMEVTPLDRDALEAEQERLKVIATKEAIDAYEKEEDGNVSPRARTPPVFSTFPPSAAPLSAPALVSSHSRNSISSISSHHSDISEVRMDDLDDVQDEHVTPKVEQESFFPVVPKKEEPEDEPAYDYLDAYGSPPPSAKRVEEAPGMPRVKCADCDASFDLLDLADHACVPSSHPPALPSKSVEPTKTEPPLSVPVDVDDIYEDIFDDEPERTPHDELDMPEDVPQDVVDETPRPVKTKGYDSADEEGGGWATVTSTRG